MVSSSDRKLASAVGAKTARACDSCIRKRARWYCAADDAFLCQNCDDSVHNANPLARRHERVRLKGSSLKNPPDFPSLESLARSWPDGFTRKARTPRGRKQAKPDPDQPFAKHPLHIIPELFSDENSQDEDNEQLLYRVPIFDPEMCTSGWPAENIPNVGTNIPASQNCHRGNIQLEIELAEFSADVESLLGKGIDEESFSMEELGLFSNFDKVKVETDGETPTANHNVDLKFEDCDDNTLETHKGGEFATIFQQSDDFESKNEKKKVSLKLDYEGLITAWADERSPWINGERPDLDSNDCWPDFMDGCGTVHNPYGEMGAMSVGHACIMDDEGRKARVSRYKEKRQKRLFSKKIRYEVRKLNAEKRPRMKGRFVKRANFVAPLSFPLLTK